MFQFLSLLHADEEPIYIWKHQKQYILNGNVETTEAYLRGEAPKVLPTLANTFSYSSINQFCCKSFHFSQVFMQKPYQLSPHVEML